jgi:Lar family restriction alleviation protein
MNAKPCPFCGHSGITIHEGSTFRWMVAECNDCGATAGEVRVQTMGDGDRKDWINNGNRDALDAWNVRATPTKEGRQMDSRAAFEAWWERKHNPRKEHIADWALREIERLRERGT